MSFMRKTKVAGRLGLFALVLASVIGTPLASGACDLAGSSSSIGAGEPHGRPLEKRRPTEEYSFGRRGAEERGQAN